jgi:hypothetical protein
MNSTISKDQSHSDYQLPTKFAMHSDPGHGWLEVPYRALVTLGITNQITSYSYRKGEWAYLEEDLDALTFIQAYLKHHGIEIDNYTYFNDMVVSVYSNHSFIRSLQPFVVD